MAKRQRVSAHTVDLIPDLARIRAATVPSAALRNAVGNPHNLWVHRVAADVDRGLYGVVAGRELALELQTEARVGGEAAGTGERYAAIGGKHEISADQHRARGAGSRGGGERLADDPIASLELHHGLDLDRELEPLVGSFDARDESAAWERQRGERADTERVCPVAGRLQR